jgi:hypothetical protein
MLRAHPGAMPVCVRATVPARRGKAATPRSRVRFVLIQRSFNRRFDRRGEQQWLRCLFQ